MHSSCMKTSLQVPEVMARPRAFRLKDHPSVVIFRDRSVLRDVEKKREVSAPPRYAVEAKRREARREDRSGAATPRRAEPRRSTSERTGIARAAIARSVSLASVSAWLRPTFLHLAGERPLRFFVPRLNVSFRRVASLSLSLLNAPRLRDVQFPGSSILRRSFPGGSFRGCLSKARERFSAMRFIIVTLVLLLVSADLEEVAISLVLMISYISLVNAI